MTKLESKSTNHNEYQTESSTVINAVQFYSYYYVMNMIISLECRDINNTCVKTIANTNNNTLAQSIVNTNTFVTILLTVYYIQQRSVHFSTVIY